MFREEGGYRPKTKTVNFILMDGGLGDHVASLPALKYIENYPWIKPLIWVPDYFLDFAKHFLLDREVYSFSQMRGRYQPHRPTKTTKWDGVTSPMKMHGVDYAFAKLLDEVPPSRDYPQLDPTKIEGKDFNLPHEYVVITTGFTAAVREFPASEINKVAQYIISKGLGVVFLGQKNTATGSAHIIRGEFRAEIDFSVGTSLIDQTTLLEAAAIMDSAKAVVGVDNGLLHVAACTHAPIVAGFTTVVPDHRLPDRASVVGGLYRVTPDESLKCRFCQSKTNFLYGHDYRNCLYSDNLCTKHMKAEKFIAHLEGIL